MQPLAVERTSNEGVELLLVEGELDIATAPRLISILNRAVQEALRSLVVDLSHVDFMDSTGLALLINAHRRLTRRSKGFAVVCPPGPLRRVFEITDMVETLHVCPDRDSARAAAAPATA
ncbi:MAG TPA: STAS domain-containing protein [Thermoleophilaceae bacterium]|nr:STAS domain-containing protein [Thermoleophilaceae bacterium]